jgi:hypothetical protein
MRNSVFRLFIFLFTCFAIQSFAQSPSGVSYTTASCVGGSCPSYTTIPTYISASYFDTINEVIYVGGPFDDMSGTPRNGLAAINAVTGTLLSWAPVVNNGLVKAIAKSGDTIFIGGTFSQINGQSRGRIAALSASTGLLLPIFTTGTSAANDTVMSLKVYGKYLYAGGKFSNILSTPRNNIAKMTTTGIIISWISTPAVSGSVKKIESSGNKIAALTNNYSLQTNDLFIIDTANTAARTLRVQSDAGLGFINDFAMRGNVAFLVGSFISVNSNNLAYATACDLSTGIFTSWNPALPISSWDDRSRFGIEYYRDSLYIGVFDASTNVQAYHQLYVSYYNSANNIRVLKTYQSNQIGVYGNYFDNILVGNARLFEIERMTAHSLSTTAVNCHFFSYCLRPPNMPGPFSVAPTLVCPGDSNLIYKVVPLGYFSTYSWSTNNSNVTVSGTTNTASADFNIHWIGAVNMRAVGITSCGISSPTYRGINVFRKVPPTASAGLDDTLNCIISQLMLHGTSTTPGATFDWSGPTGTSSSDSIFANLTGDYIVTVHGPNFCWWPDTMSIVLDTVPPIILPFGTVSPLTCTTITSVLDASGIYPGDSLFWTGPGLLNNTNPANANQSNNYLLKVTSRQNGCDNTDTIFVPQNINPPNASVIASDTLLTCTVQNIVLTGNSTNTGVFFQWTDTSGTFFADPDTISVPGVYQLHATNPANGCVNVSNLIFITSWTTPPGINPLPDTISLNCSYSALPLNATSLTSGTTLNWNGPLSYSSPNPGTATQQGYYFVTAIHPQNGCTSVDSVFVDYQLTLDVNAGNDTSICPGSGAVLQSVPVAGTSPFNFSWNNAAGNSALVTVYPTDTTAFIVNVIDANGCVGNDTVNVNVPDPIADSTLSFQPCDPLQPTGQIQVYAFNGVPPFQFSSDNGLSWNTTGIFSNLNYGTYNYLIQDFLGCTKNETATIDTNSLSPTPQFLVSSSPMQGDTIVVVDISNPRPDSVSWDFPSNAIVIDSNMFTPIFINTDTGAFPLTMHAFYGSCEVIDTRIISVHPFDSTFANAWNNNGIDTVIIYPDPNNGNFNLGVTLFAKQNFVILVYDANGVEHARQQVYDSDNWNGQISVNNPVPGNYVLRVIAEYDSAQQLFVISQ